MKLLLPGLPPIRRSSRSRPDTSRSLPDAPSSPPAFAGCKGKRKVPELFQPGPEIEPPRQTDGNRSGGGSRGLRPPGRPAPGEGAFRAFRPFARVSRDVRPA